MTLRSSHVSQRNSVLGGKDRCVFHVSPLVPLCLRNTLPGHGWIGQSTAHSKVAFTAGRIHRILQGSQACRPHLSEKVTKAFRGEEICFESNQNPCRLTVVSEVEEA